MEEQEQLEFKQSDDITSSNIVEDNDDNDDTFNSDIINHSPIQYQSADILHYLDHISSRKSLPIATKYEICRILSERIYQLNNGAPLLIIWNGSKSGLNVTELIAREELRQRKIPFIIRRTFPNGHTEDWKLQDFRRIDVT